MLGSCLKALSPLAAWGFYTLSGAPHLSASIQVGRKGTFQQQRLSSKGAEQLKCTYRPQSHKIVSPLGIAAWTLEVRADMSLTQDGASVAHILLPMRRSFQDRSFVRGICFPMRRSYPISSGKPYTPPAPTKDQRRLTQRLARADSGIALAGGCMGRGSTGLYESCFP